MVIKYYWLFVDNKGGYLGSDNFALIDNRFEAILSKRCKLYCLFVGARYDASSLIPSNSSNENLLIGRTNTLGFPPLTSCTLRLLMTVSPSLPILASNTLHIIYVLMGLNSLL